MKPSRYQEESIPSPGIRGENPSLQLDAAREKSWTGQRLINVLRRLPLFTAAVVILLLASALSLTVGTALGVANFRDVGYPDSATLFKIAEFIRTGHIYSDITRPPYHLTLYGPLTYVLLAIPYRLAQASRISPQVLVRLSIVGVLCLCVLLIFRINKRLYSSGPSAWFSALFAVSALPMAFWTTQIRGDLLGVAFSLLSVYLFLRTSGRAQSAGSAFCAGIAPLIKQTFLAAPVAIIIWLTFMRRFKEAAFWAAAFALAVAGGYGLVLWHDPLMLKHLATLQHPVLEYQSAKEIIRRALAQPVVPFAALGGFLALWKRVPEKTLLVIYCGVAWGIAALTSPNIGGSINYFWEPLLVSAVLAGPGLFELQRKLNRTPIIVTAMLFFLLYKWASPMLTEARVYLRECRTEISDYQARKTKWEAFMATVSGQRVLSTLPEVTVRSTTPEMPDPYLNATLELRGQWDSAPVVDQINSGAFDLIVIKAGQADGSPLWIYRGVGSWSKEMWAALKRTYQRSCVFEDMEIWLPRRTSPEIPPGLSAIGCIAAPNEGLAGSAFGNKSRETAVYSATLTKGASLWNFSAH